MTRIAVTVILLALVSAATGCAGGAPLDYSARAGRPDVTTVSRQVSLSEFSPQAACKDCVSGADPAKVQVTVPVQQFSWPTFPTSGRELLCRVVSVPWTYQAIWEATVSPRTFIWRREAVIRLQACQAVASGREQCYDLSVTVGDTALPRNLAEGDTVTLRFLGDGTFFDIKEWSADCATVATKLLPQPRG